MWRYSVFILVFWIAFSSSKSVNPRHEVRKFPGGILFGCATASYQIEGAWDEDGKSPNIWDTLTHQKPCKIKECHTGDVGANSYHMVKRDVEMMRELGLDYYRFSLSWSRILPNSFSNQINEAGVQYYNDLINEMLKYNITPMITLYHWDLPQKLQDLGGWTNPHIVEWYSDYARICYELFGDRVKNWITINEPQEICYAGYSSASKAPLYSYGGYADYMCAKYLLLAHAKAYRIYDKEYRPIQKGVIGIALSAAWFDPATDSKDDISAAEDAKQFKWGLYANPIFSESGDYPDVMKQKIAAKSAKQGYPRSRLPEFTPEEIDLVRGSADYLGINHYSSCLAYRNESVYSAHSKPSMKDDMDLVYYQPSDWVGSASSWLKVVPSGFYKLLTALRVYYNNPPIYITENGYSSTVGLEDDDRISYYVQYLDAMLDAIEEGSDIRGYTSWSLMDNFEWMEGYTARFGLYEVDHEDPMRPRTARKSAFVYKQILRTRELNPYYEPPADRRMTIGEGH